MNKVELFTVRTILVGCYVLFSGEPFLVGEIFCLSVKKEPDCTSTLPALTPDTGQPVVTGDSVTARGRGLMTETADAASSCSYG